MDILAQEYVDKLTELQEPIVGASFGKVHRAQEKGQELVVKVQRPGLKYFLDIDLKSLNVIAEYLQKIDPKSDCAKRDWVSINDECASVLYQEIDYAKEAYNTEQFQRTSNKWTTSKSQLYIGIWEYTTPQVLTMEYVPGIKINRIQASDQLGVARQRQTAVESYLEQILSHNFFHADPHPGNIVVTISMVED
ncbi:Protein ACTIVITY OF BC1 COMPLEX KINASE 8, chloroplastic [Salvia divinorum]|uniref:Protein ACTIVITY OF BC1 COMPLEX KINASE 8, chloroplastic n=1 Tax=Salvia divinorum TaxID=28513 RepID=A0ABD1FXX4_SALDI